MLGLPHSTEVIRPLPKAQLYKKFGIRQTERNRFDDDISRMEIVNFIAPQTLPAIAEGKDVKAIFVVKVCLKKKDYDVRNIELITKLIPQRLVFALQFEQSLQVIIFHTKIFVSRWLPIRESLNLIGTNLNLDGIWNNCVAQISGLEFTPDKSIDETIRINEQREKIQKQIDLLQKRLHNCSQNRQQLELFHQIKQLKTELSKFEIKTTK